MSKRSSQIIEDIFRRHFPGPQTVLDLTYATGGFWRWDHGALSVAVHHNPGWDFRATTLPDKSYDVVAFDPPHTSAGHGASADLYGICRVHGGPRNRADVRVWLMAGVNEAARIARTGIIVKYKDCVEWAKPSYWWDDVEWLLEEQGWRIIENIYNDGRRAQPAGRGTLNAANLTRYAVAVRNKKRRMNNADQVAR